MKLFCVLFGMTLFLGFQPLQADEMAERILATTRFAVTLQKQQNLHGFMSKNGKKTPVSLFLRNENIQFLYRAKGKETRFHMHLKGTGFELFEIKEGKNIPLSNARLIQPINGTDVTYEDLSMSFLYWKDARVVGEEKINGQLCHKLRLINPSKSEGRYRIVYVWVHQKYGALMKMVGYNAQGKPLKQFQVTDLMRIGRDYTLKKMRVDTINPDTNRVIGITYLRFKKAKEVDASKNRR